MDRYTFGHLHDSDQQYRGTSGVMDFQTHPEPEISFSSQAWFRSLESKSRDEDASQRLFSPSTLGGKLGVANSKPRSSSAPEVRPLTSADTLSSATSETSFELPLPSANHEALPGNQRASLKFKAKHERQGTMEITESVFDLMKKRFGKDDSDRGRIYVLHNADHPGLYKIGRTFRPIKERRREIEHCVEYKLVAINDDNHIEIPNYQRVEKLIHAELWNFERDFACKSHEKPKNHGEWFEISEEKALEVVGRWKKWISTDPYSDGRLRPKEFLRMNIFRQDPDMMNSLVTDDGESWRWDVFTSISGLYLEYLWFKNFLCAKRPKPMSDCSRFDSLLKHWKSNLVVSLLIAIIPVISTPLAYIFPSFSTVIALADTMLLVSICLLYAA